MNVIQVSSFFKPSWEAGGVARAAYDISRVLVEKGINVTLICSNKCKMNYNISTRKFTHVDGIKVYYLENVLRGFGIVNPPLLLRLPLILLKQRKSIDIIHIHEHRTFSAVIVYLYARISRIPYVIQVHGDLNPPSKNKRLSIYYDKYFGKRILVNASTVIALNDTESRSLLANGIGEERIAIVPNGIQLGVSDYPAIKGNFKKRLGISESDRVVLYLGRISESKGLDLLIDSFDAVRKVMDNTWLLFVGPDVGFQSVLQKKIRQMKLEKRVIFTGYVTDREKIDVLADSDVMVTPKYTGFPISFLESCSNGVPLITTSEGDKLEWINNRVGLVSRFEKDSLAQAILSILQNEGIRSSFKNNCKSIMENEFNLSVIVDNIIEIYNHGIMNGIRK